jgi:hypothetical protein
MSNFPPNARWRWTSLLAVVAVSLTTLAAADEAPPAAQIESILSQLTSPDFGVRARAEAALEAAAATQIDALEQAAVENPEHAARVVSVFERLLVGESRQAPEQAVARAACVSPSVDAVMSLRRMGNFNETSTTIAAERALNRLRRSDSPAASYASAALARQRILIQSRAIAAIRAGGGRIIFASWPDPLNSTITNLVSDPFNDSEDEISSIEPRGISHVILLPQWKLGADGLEHLARLDPVSTVMLFAVAGCNVSEQDVAHLLRSEYPYEYFTRSRATLGVSSMNLGGGPCQVSGVTEGLAAEQAGIRPGDIIESLDGETIKTFDDLVQKLKDHEPGDEVTITVVSTGFDDFQFRFQNPRIEPVPPTPPPPKVEKKVILSDWSQLPDFPSIHARR